MGEHPERRDSPGSQVRVAVIDDSPLMRAATAAILRRQPDMEVVAEVSRGPDLLECLPTAKPDIVVLDLRLGTSTRTGIDLAGRMRSISPQVRVVVYSGYLADHYAEMLVQFNVHGYVLKTDHPNTIVDAVRIAARGGVFFSPEVYERIAKRYQG